MNFRNPKNPGVPAWRVALEQHLTRQALDEYNLRRAPEWVLHRVHNGKEVLNRRHLVIRDVSK